MRIQFAHQQNAVAVCLETRLMVIQNLSGSPSRVHDILDGDGNRLTANGGMGCTRCAVEKLVGNLPNAWLGIVEDVRRSPLLNEVHKAVDRVRRDDELGSEVNPRGHGFFGLIRACCPDRCIGGKSGSVDPSPTTQRVEEDRARESRVTESEGGAAKSFMVRAGEFAGVDIAITWHPASMTRVDEALSLANTRMDFQFTGRASHAAAAPHLGRSARNGTLRLSW